MMADGSTITVPPGASGNGRQETERFLVPTAQWRDSGIISPSQAQPERTLLEQATAEARLALEEAALAATHAAQRALTSVNVLAEALSILEQARGTSADGPRVQPTSHPVALLSPREREVLTLVAAGQTNKAIAAALYISPNTVKTHVTSLLHKLQADSRVQLAAIATKSGLDERRGPRHAMPVMPGDPDGDAAAPPRRPHHPHRP
jgi:DNA-binding NarL/FixJ family response regulator